MKKLFMLLVLLGLCAAAGFIYWEKNAKHIEAQIAEGITKLNAEIKAQSGVTALEYENIAISGFPYSITITLKNPIIRLPLSRWIKDANPKQEWVEEHRFTGDLTLSADWKVTKYTLTLPKMRESVSFLNKTPFFNRKAQSATAPHCSLSLDLMESFEHLWQPQKMLASLLADASLLRALECEVKNYQLSSSDVSAERIQNAQEISFILNIDKAKESTALDSSLHLSIQKFQAYAGSDAYFSAFLKAFPALYPYLHYQEVAINTQAFLGEQNLKITADYTGETLKPDWKAKAEITVSEFSLDNGLGNFSGTLQAANNPLEGGTKREITFEAKLHATIATLLEQLLQRRFAISLSRSPTIIGYNAFFIDTGYLTTQDIPAMAASLYPKLNGLSPFDVYLKGRIQAIPSPYDNALPKQASMALDQLEIHNRDWKIGLQGRADYNPMNLLPTLNATLSIQNGDTVFKQLANKLVVMEQWRQRQSNRPNVIITNELLADLHRMVEAIVNGKQENTSAEVSSLGNPKFQLEFKNFSPRINGLDMSQIMLLFNELISTHLTSTTSENYVAPPAQYQPSLGFPAP